MDSLRRKPAADRKPINMPAPRQEVVFPAAKKREEIYISRIEAERMESHEKKFQKGINTKKVFWITFSVLVVTMMCIAGYFLWKTYSVSQKIHSESQVQTTIAQSVRALASPVIQKKSAPLRGQDSGRINILLLGAAGEKKPGGNLTDTVMVMSLDTKNNKVALLSLPRDFYAPIGDSKSFTKINSLYPIGIKNKSGVELIKGAVEKITDLNLNYYLVIDFDGFQKIIDDIGGVNITSERDIYDTTYPGPNYSYETFALSKGFHKLDGATALKYVRQRHGDPEGDFGRAKRQQQVIQAVKNKMFSLQTFFNVITLNNILNTLGDNIKTDIAIEDIEGFISLSKTLDLENISNVVLDAWKSESLLKVSHVQVGAVSAFILIPRVGNYTEIQDLAKNIFNQGEIKKRQEFIAAENASIGIINNSGSAALSNKIKTLLSDRLNLKNVHLIPNASNEITKLTSVTQKMGGNKIFTLDELIKKIPAKFSDGAFPVLDGDDDIVIILGSDLVETYKYDDASLEDFNNAQDKQDNIDFINQ